MGELLGSVIVGLVAMVLGASNRKGNLSTLHWYHRRRVTEENRLPFGRLVGLGTMIMGGAIAAYGCLSFAAQQTQREIFFLIGTVVMVGGLITGLGLSLYAMIKYNKGIF